MTVLEAMKGQPSADMSDCPYLAEAVKINAQVLGYDTSQAFWQRDDTAVIAHFPDGNWMASRL